MFYLLVVAPLVFCMYFKATKNKKEITVKSKIDKLTDSRGFIIFKNGIMDNKGQYYKTIPFGKKWIKFEEDKMYRIKYFGSRKVPTVYQAIEVIPDYEKYIHGTNTL